MDREGCPQGWASDHLLYFDRLPGEKCETNVATFVAPITIILLFQLIVVIGQFHLWYRREQHRSKVETALSRFDKYRLVWGKRIPLVPSIGLFGFIALGIFVILTCNDLANDGNGVSTFLIGAVMLNYMLISLLFNEKLSSFHAKTLRVGSKVSAAIKNDNLLISLDMNGRIAIFLCFLAMMGVAFSMCIFGLVFPGRHACVQAGYGFLALFSFQLMYAQLSHLARVKRAVRDVIYMSNLGESEMKSELRAVSSKLFEHQLVIIGVAGPGAVFFTVVATGVLSTRHYIVVISATIGVCLPLFIIMSNYIFLYRRYIRKKGVGRSQTPAASPLVENARSNVRPASRDTTTVENHPVAISPFPPVLEPSPE